MPQYLLMMIEQEAPYEAADDALTAEVLGAHRAFADKHRGRLRGGEALKPTSTAKTVRQGIVTDGPFLETKEALGGYYLVEAADLGEAVEIAKQVPARFGGVEVREIMVFN
jgi:hypothetical protein